MPTQINNVDILERRCTEAKLQNDIYEHINMLIDALDSNDIYDSLDNLDAIELKIILNSFEKIERILSRY